MNPRELLYRTASKVAAHTEAAVKVKGGTNAPTPPEPPTQPATNKDGPIAPVVGKPRGTTRQKRASALDTFLMKTAGQVKTAAPRPGRLDGDLVLNKLASRHKVAKKCAK